MGEMDMGGAYMPHGMCYLWKPPLLWLHVVSDATIGLAYWAIPPFLLWFVVKTRRAAAELGPPRPTRGLPHDWLFLAFGLFIVACGTTHLLAVWNVWTPRYWISGGVKAVTALASVATAAALPLLVPRLVTVFREARLSELQREELLQLAAERAARAEAERAAAELRDIAAENARLYGEAQEANRAKAEFLAVMSHELRTPLNAVLGYAELMAMELPGPLTAGQRQHVERIQRSATQLRELIDQVLTLTRLEAHGLEPELQPVPLRLALQETLEVVRPVAEAKGLEVSVEVEPSDLHCSADVLMLRQVLLNLASNAVKFTKAGRVDLRARRERGRVRIDVADTGEGIDPQHQERIFDPFWQVHQGRTRPADGVGLGLSVAQRMARVLGGDIEVVSAPGEGAVFTVWLEET